MWFLSILIIFHSYLNLSKIDLQTFRSMKISIWILMTLIFLQLTHQTHIFTQLPNISSEDLQNDDLVEVEQTSNNYQVSHLTPNYYVIKADHKQKKHAYNLMQNLFKRVVGIIREEKLIPDEESLVKSKIKPQYLTKKRRWSFSTIFVIFGNENQLDRCFKKLSFLKIQRLNTRPSINFLNQKVISLNVYNSAKQKLVKMLQNIGGFQIKEVIQIQIKGAEIQNSDILEIQIEEQQNLSEETISEEDIHDLVNDDKGPLEMKIIFRVGRINQEDTNNEENYDQIEIDQAQSESSQESL